MKPFYYTHEKYKTFKKSGAIKDEIWFFGLDAFFVFAFFLNSKILIFFSKFIIATNLLCALKDIEKNLIDQKTNKSYNFSTHFIFLKIFYDVLDKLTFYIRNKTMG